jgi:hypothetical protein
MINNGLLTDIPPVLDQPVGPFQGWSIPPSNILSNGEGATRKPADPVVRVDLRKMPKGRMKGISLENLLRKGELWSAG